MNPIVCMGEALVDLFADGGVGELSEAQRFTRAQGGAVANVAVGLARLRAPVRFAGAVGRDAFGRFLIAALAREGVDVDLVRVVPEHTALAFVARKPGGERDFEFFREPGADSRYAADDMPAGALERVAALHVGGVSLSREPARSACMTLLGKARELRVRTSIDVNVRAALFDDQRQMRDLLLAACALVDLVKCSDDDARALGIDEGEFRDALWTANTRGLLVTRGARGAAWFAADAQGEVAAPAVEAVDTTGAGDAFMAALLWRVTSRGDAPLDAALIAEAARYGCAAGALACKREGATASLPGREELEAAVR